MVTDRAVRWGDRGVVKFAQAEERPEGARLCDVFGPARLFVAVGCIFGALYSAPK
jgi:hypothetical protein